MKIIEQHVKSVFYVITFIFIFFFTGCCFKKKSSQKTPTIINQGALSKKDFIIRSFKESSSKEQEEKLSKIRSSQPESRQDTIQWVEGQLSDIPSLLLSKPIDASRDAYGRCSIVYQTSQSPDEIKQFYLKEMERTGWKKEAQFEAPDFLYSFKKDTDVCIVSIRHHAHYWGVLYSTTIHVYVQR